MVHFEGEGYLEAHGTIYFLLACWCSDILMIPIFFVKQILNEFNESNDKYLLD